MRRLPAEWEPQQRVYFSFPRRDGDWGKVLATASEAMVRAANQINEVCPVTLVVGDSGHFQAYAPSYRGEVLEVPTDDCWIRDSGPITVFSPQPTLLDFTFNGWGGKFDATRDNRLPKEIYTADFPAAVYERIPSVLEGGSIESDGQGTLLTTTRCLLSAGRNDYANRSEAEAMLRTHLGTQRFIWLQHGELDGDDTDAHIDTVARFYAPGVIAYVEPPGPKDQHHLDFSRMEAELHQYADTYRLLALPFPDPVYSAVDGHRLPASYANFLICNGTLFLPVYEVPSDAKAVEVLETEGTYRVVPVNCRPFVEQHGALHCLTMQIPAW